VFPCGHIFSRAFCDRLFELDLNYSRNEHGEFQAAVVTRHLDAKWPTCPTCRKPLSGIQRYNRMLKRWRLNTILKSVSIESHEKYETLLREFELFETETETSRKATVNHIRHVKNEKHRIPIMTHNLEIITIRAASFNIMKEKVRLFRRDVDQCKQPLMKVYQMSLLNDANAQQEYDAFESVESQLLNLDTKFRLLADLLTLRLETFYLEDHQELLSRLTSVECLEAAKQGYIKVIHSCYEYAKAADAHKSSCEGTAYYSLAIEFLLLQLHFVTLEIRASKAISVNSKTERPCEQGDRILSTCRSLLERYPTCESYKLAVDDAEVQFLDGQASLFDVRYGR